MAYEYVNGIYIAGLTLTLQPEQYSPNFTKLGQWKRTCGGGILEVDVNGRKLIVEIRGIALAQVETIKKRCALFKIVDFRDHVPISEKGQVTRTVYENLGSETIESETIYTYIPTYRIIVTDYQQTYGGNMVNYSIIGEEV